MIKGRYLIDTNILIYSTLAHDPRGNRAREVLDFGRQSDCHAYISVQNLAEMYPNLTGPKTQPSDQPEQATRKIIAIAQLPYLQVLPITGEVLRVALELCSRYNVRRQRYFDMQLAATALANNIPTILTENRSDFEIIDNLTAIDPFNGA